MGVVCDGLIVRLCSGWNNRALSWLLIETERKTGNWQTGLKRRSAGIICNLLAAKNIPPPYSDHSAEKSSLTFSPAKFEIYHNYTIHIEIQNDYVHNNSR